KDIAPAAPVHIIVVPKEHIESANEINTDNSKYVSAIFEKIPEIAKSQGIDSYRIINNCGEDAGQTVKHLHFHILGGMKMGEKII
nr:HIT domain-containing protein [Eubacterium sp.]